MNTDAKKVLMTFVVLSKFARKNFFFSQNFSTNQNGRKNRIPLFDFLLIGIERPMNTDTKKILLTFVVLSKFARKIFFFLEIFRPINIREKIEFHYSIFYSLESRDQWPLMLKKFYWRLLYCRNPREKIFFFHENFWANQNWRKNRIQLFDFFVIRIERPMNTDAKKILFTFVVLSKSARKKLFFSQNFWTNQNWRKNRIQLFDFFVIRIERPMNTDA